MSEPVHSRRVMLQILGAAGGALAAFSAIGCGGEESGGASGSSASAGANCNDTAGVDTTTRTSLHYNANGPDAARHCEACMFFTANGDCGTCQLFPGPVAHTGTCDSFAARPS